VIGALETPAGFRLPPATASHTRSYLSSNTKDITKKQKVFDAFVVVDRAEWLLAVFDADVDEAVARDLADLLSELNYFGRSESWVEMRLSRDVNLVALNCLPAGETDERAGLDPVRVACLRGESSYTGLPDQPRVGRGNKARAFSWLDAVSMSTSELLGDGWSAPPSQAMVDFMLPRNALQPRFNERRATTRNRFSVATFALQSSVLPRVTDTVPFAERIRAHLMGIHRRLVGGDLDGVSPLFSGKAAGGGPAQGHGHIFVMPLDEDSDGRIDHLIVKSSQEFDASELQALDGLRSVWQPNGRPDVRIVLVSLANEVTGQSSKIWISTTPFVTGRHHRKGRGKYHAWLADEIRKECGFHGLPEPASVEWIDRSQVGGHPFRWMEFVRSRKGRAPLRGHGCILTFDEEVKGPFTLGALAHFGMGLFSSGS